MVNNNGVETLYYGYTDNQGSLIALTDASGNVIEKYAYDPWGARRNPADWTQKDNRTSWITNRGYTMHEHIDAFGIINMNGRVYDPATAMFMNTDPLVQSPDNWVNYNQYTYCFNNPLIYSDPSGYANSATGEKQFWELMEDGNTWKDATNFTISGGFWRTTSKYGGGGGGGFVTRSTLQDAYDMFTAKNPTSNYSFNDFVYAYSKPNSSNEMVLNWQTTSKPGSIKSFKNSNNDMFGEFPLFTVSYHTVTIELSSIKPFDLSNWRPTMYDNCFNSYQHDFDKKVNDFLLAVAVIGLTGGTGAAAEIGEGAQLVVQSSSNYIIQHPEILVGILEGIVKSNFGPDTEMSSSVVNSFIMNFGMNLGETAAYLEALLKGTDSKKK